MAMNAPLPSHAMPAVEPRPVPGAMLEALRARFGERVLPQQIAIGAQGAGVAIGVEGGVSIDGGVVRPIAGIDTVRKVSFDAVVAV
jgi:hypothetical protein